MLNFENLTGDNPQNVSDTNPVAVPTIVAPARTRTEEYLCSVDQTGTPPRRDYNHSYPEGTVPPTPEEYNPTPPHRIQGDPSRLAIAQLARDATARALFMDDGVSSVDHNAPSVTGRRLYGCGYIPGARTFLARRQAAIAAETHVELDTSDSGSDSAQAPSRSPA